MRIGLLIMLGLASGGVAAQVDSLGTHQVLRLDLGVNQVRDENLHPKVSTGTLTELTYGFERRRFVWQQFRFSIGYSRPRAELEDVAKSINLRLNVGYSRTYKLAEGKKLAGYLGPEARLAYSVLFFPNWDDSHLYWGNYLSFGAHGTLKVNVSPGNEWHSSISFPLYGVYSRPPQFRLFKIDEVSFGGIAANLNSDLTASHWGNLFFARFQTAYRFPVFHGKNEALHYCLEFLRIKHPDGNPFTQLTHQVGLSLYL